MVGTTVWQCFALTGTTNMKTRTGTTTKLIIILVGRVAAPLPIGLRGAVQMLLRIDKHMHQMHAI